MAVENLLSTPMTLRSTGRLADRSATGAPVRSRRATVEVTAAASATSTYDFFVLPSDAIIRSIKIETNDLASTGSPTVDVGLFHADLANGGDDNALLDGVDVTSAVNSVTGPPIAAPEQRAWDYVASQTTDPNRDLTVRATIKDADTNTGGTMTLEIQYV
jgi:hypothetical protein